ncbi:MAG TPA: 3-oxoacid CoA-transferase, partial [Thermoplasmata archaeon]|nr:3-oxoacid CoA-transferase [Thermoplasmata archaeon]
MAEERRFSTIELMASVASHLLENGKTVAVGTGLPLIAASLAKATHAPELVIFFEAGGVDPQIPTLPVSVGDSRTVYKALVSSSLADVMETMSRGFVDYAFLGGAQIDMYGNLNSTFIGEDYTKPKVRLPGSGGANDFGSLCWETIYLMGKHTKRKFVKKCDFITTPGWLSGPGAREEAGLPAGTGPSKVITDLGVLGFDEETKRMKLLAVHPGVSVEQVQANTAFELLIADEVKVTTPPTQEELSLLREKIDPKGYI